MLKYQYFLDLPYVLIFILIILSKKNFKLVPILTSVLAFFIAILYYNFGGTFYVAKFFIADLRPIIIYSFIIIFFDKFNCSNNYMPYFFVVLIIFTSFFSFIGLFSLETYQQLSEFYNPRFNDDRLNVASVSAASGRYSSIFSQPATAGEFFFILIPFLYSMKTKALKYKFYIYFYLFLVLVAGLLTISSFFSFGLTILMLFYILNLFKHQILLIIIILVFLLPFLINMNYDIDIFSGRYSENSNFLPLLFNLTWSDFLIPNPYFSLSFPRAFGDSSFVMKLLSGGLLYLLYYYILLISLHLKFISLLKRYFKYSYWFNIIFFILILGDSGFTAFSQPRLTLLFLLFIVFYLSRTSERHENISIS